MRRRSIAWRRGYPRRRRGKAIWRSKEGERNQPLHPPCQRREREGGGVPPGAEERGVRAHHGD